MSTRTGRRSEVTRWRQRAAHRRHSAAFLVCALLVVVAAPAMAAWQDAVQAKTSASAGTLAAPAQVGCAGNLSGGTLSWDQVPGATGYEVIGPLGALGTLLNQVLNLTNGVLSYTLPAVSLGQYKVRAVLAGTDWKSSYATTTISLNSSLRLVCS